MWIMFLTLYVKAGIIPILIFKNQRSGSSWMTAMLNTFEGIFITEEIIQGKAYHRGNIWEEGQSWVMESFVRPTRNYRYFWDGKIKKPEGNFSVIGSTLNPFFTNQFLNFREIAESLPNLKLIVYHRSNVIKHAISIIRGELLMQKCGTKVSKSNCKIDDKTEVEISLLELTILRISVSDDALFKHATKIAPLLDNWFHILTYEDLRKEDSVAWDSLFEFIGYVPSATSLKETGGRCSVNCTKTTSDDLRDVIINYDEVQSFISERYPCLLSHLREIRPDQTMPEIGLTCPSDLFAAGGKEINKRKQEFFEKTRKEWLECCREENYKCACSWKV